MKIHNFFVDFEKQGIGDAVAGAVFEIKDKEIIHQIKNVLKLKETYPSHFRQTGECGRGERVVFCDGNLSELVCELMEIKNNAIRTRVLEARKNENEPAVKVVLYCSILKRENFEWAVQKAVEVGVSEIVPIICERTIKTGFKKERLEKIIKEAAEQSGRGILPRMRNVRRLALNERGELETDETDDTENNDKESCGLNLVFDASGESLGMTHSKLGNLGLTKSQYSEIGIFIGPEGGWSGGELETFHTLAHKNPDNFKIASLGKTTLRAETSAVVGVYSAIFLF